MARGFSINAPGETRTPNLLIRSQMLYPIELRALLLSYLDEIYPLSFVVRTSSQSFELRTKVGISLLSMANGRYKTRTCDLHDVNVAL